MWAREYPPDLVLIVAVADCQFSLGSNRDWKWPLLSFLIVHLLLNLEEPGCTRTCRPCLPRPSRNHSPSSRPSASPASQVVFHLILPTAGSHPYVYPYRYDCSVNSARKPGSEAAAGKFAPPCLNGAAISSLSHPSQRNRNSTKGRKRQRHGSDESGEESDDG